MLTQEELFEGYKKFYKSNERAIAEVNYIMENAMKRWLKRPLNIDLEKIQRKFRIYRVNIYVLNHVMFLYN